MLRDINEANWDHAHRLLQCLTVAVRPLRVAELVEVLAIDFGTTTREGTSELNMDWRWEDHREAVLSACSSLISIVNDDDDDDSSQVVQFSHFSVKEFLTSSRIANPTAGMSRFYIHLEPAHTILAKVCLGVLLRLGELVDERNIEVKFPLAQYAAEHWVDHARFEDVSSHIREGMEDLFNPDKPYFAAWVQVHDIDIGPAPESLFGFFARKSNTATPLYYAALCGFHDLAEQLIIKHPQQVDITGGYYVSPLVAALSGGHLKTAQLFYEHGADVDVHGKVNRTPLYGASRPGHLEVVEWLLSRGANPNVQDNYGWTALHTAALYGRVEVSRLLLQHKVDINAKTEYGETPLHLASEAGHVSVARLLLERGADMNTRDNNRGTPLHYASRSGDLEVARLLVEYGTDIDAENNDGGSAFQVASEGRHHDIAEFLSDKGCTR